MLLKVNVNMPEDTTELYEKLNDTLAKILIKKLHPNEIERLINLLEKEDFNLTL